MIEYFYSVVEQTDIGSLGCTFSVLHLAASKKDAMRILPNEGQYLHLVNVAAPLECWGHPTLTATMDIGRWSPSIWSFTECGGLLGNSAIRAFFGVLSARHEVVVTGYEKVQYEGRPKQHVICKNENRLNHYEHRLVA